MSDARPLMPPNLQSWVLGIGAALALAAASHPAAAQAVIVAAADDEAAGTTVLHGVGLEHFAPDQVFRILGKDVVSATGEKMGRVVDVLFDHAGKPFAAVIDFGGFLGVGTRKIAVDWSALRFDMGEKKNVIILDLGREQLQAAPEYKESDKSITVVSLPQLGPSQASSDQSW
jgi:hypothetical protein